MAQIDDFFEKVVLDKVALVIFDYVLLIDVISVVKNGFFVLGLYVDLIVNIFDWLEKLGKLNGGEDVRNRIDDAWMNEHFMDWSNIFIQLLTAFFVKSFEDGNIIFCEIVKSLFEPSLFDV